MEQTKTTFQLLPSFQMCTSPSETEPCSTGQIKETEAQLAPILLTLGIKATKRSQPLYKICLLEPKPKNRDPLLGFGALLRWLLALWS